jgi:hypothetical protein
MITYAVNNDNVYALEFLVYAGESTSLSCNNLSSENMGGIVGQGEQGPAGPEGPPGSQGEPGPQGPTGANR